MARTTARARPEREEVMVPERQSCPGCGSFMRLRLKIRRCEREDCACYRRPYRPKAEGVVALPPVTEDLGRTDWEPWRDLRHRLDQRRHARTLRTRFRRDPKAYLDALEQKACQPTLVD